MIRRLLPFRFIRLWRAARLLQSPKKPSGVVLGYHYVTEASSVGNDLYTVSQRNFDQHVRMIKKWFLPVVCRKLNTPHSSKMHKTVITFDDGRQNNHDFAFPILRKYGVAATFFVSPGLVGQPGFMNWDTIKNLAHHGMEIGCHGYAHEDFSQLPPETGREFLQKAKAEFSHHLSEPVVSMAFPHGNMPALGSGFGDILNDLGFSRAFGFDGKALNESSDPYSISRYMAVDVTGITLLENLAELIARSQTT